MCGLLVQWSALPPHSSLSQVPAQVLLSSCGFPPVSCYLPTAIFLVKTLRGWYDCMMSWTGLPSRLCSHLTPRRGSRSTETLSRIKQLHNLSQREDGLNQFHFMLEWNLWRKLALQGHISNEWMLFLWLVHLDLFSDYYSHETLHLSFICLTGNIYLIYFYSTTFTSPFVLRLNFTTW